MPITLILINSKHLHESKHHVRPNQLVKNVMNRSYGQHTLCWWTNRWEIGRIVLLNKLLLIFPAADRMKNDSRGLRRHFNSLAGSQSHSDQVKNKWGFHWCCCKNSKPTPQIYTHKMYALGKVCFQFRFHILGWTNNSIHGDEQVQRSDSVGVKRKPVKVF